MNLEITQQHAHNSNSINIMIQGMNKVRCCAVLAGIYESSFWTSNEVYETSQNQRPPFCAQTFGKTTTLPTQRALCYRLQQLERDNVGSKVYEIDENHAILSLESAA